LRDRLFVGLWALNFLFVTAGYSLSWGLAGTVGPAAGGFLLAAAPFALWPAASVVCLVAMLGALALERRVPERYRRIPRGDAAPSVPAVAPVG